MLINLCVFKEAGGNPTGLVLTRIPFNSHLKLGKILLNGLMEKQTGIPKLDQVAFLLEREKNFLRFRMAGGENCGNALLAMAYYAGNMRNSEVELEIILGNKEKELYPQKIKASSENNYVTVNFDLKNLEMEFLENGTIFHMDGISHLVLSSIKNNGMYMNINKCKGLLEKYKIAQKEAAGIIFIEDLINKIKIKPLIYVRALNIYTQENSCGSASIATGLWKMLLENKEIEDFPIIQMTGEPIYVSIRRDNSKIMSTLKAKIDIIYQGSIEINGNLY